MYIVQQWYCGVFDLIQFFEGRRTEKKSAHRSHFFPILDGFYFHQLTSSLLYSALCLIFSFFVVPVEICHRLHQRKGKCWKRGAASPLMAGEWKYAAGIYSKEKEKGRKGEWLQVGPLVCLSFSLSVFALKKSSSHRFQFPTVTPFISLIVST